MKIKFYGTRGSFPTASSEARGIYTLKYGGNTTCLYLTTNNSENFIIDAGTGSRLLGMDLLKTPQNGKTPKILFTHEHQDHVEGIPSFAPFYNPDNEFHVYAKENPRKIEELLRERQRVEFFPVAYSIPGVDGVPCMTAGKMHHDIEKGILTETVEVSYCATNHPDGCVAYKFRERNNIFIFGGDHEFDLKPEVDDKLAQFYEGSKIIALDT